METTSDTSEHRRTKSSTNHNFFEDPNLTWDEEYDIGSRQHSEDEYTSVEDEETFQSPLVTINPEDIVTHGRVYRLDSDRNDEQDSNQVPQVVQHVRNIRPLDSAGVYNFDEILKILPPQ